MGRSVKKGPFVDLKLQKRITRGEGRTSAGQHPVSPWGVLTKGYKTRKNKRTNSMIVRRRNAKTTG